MNLGRRDIGPHVVAAVFTALLLGSGIVVLKLSELSNGTDGDRYARFMESR